VRNTGPVPASNTLSCVERRVPTTRDVRRRFFFPWTVEGEHTFLEFAIDGKSLREWVREWEGVDEPPGETTLLSDSRPDWAIEQLNRLLGNRPHQHGERAWLLFCEACFDEGCGGITADVSRAGGHVTWSSFGWDTDHEKEDEEPDRYDASFSFDEAAYDALLTQTRNAFKAVKVEDKLA
jgi:hypothetical protein